MALADAPLHGLIVASLMTTSSTRRNLRPVPYTDSFPEGVVGASAVAASSDFCPMLNAHSSILGMASASIVPASLWLRSMPDAYSLFSSGKRCASVVSACVNISASFSVVCFA